MTNKRIFVGFIIILFFNSFFYADDRISDYKRIRITDSMYVHGSNWDQIIKDNDTLFLRYKCFKYENAVLISDLIFEIHKASGERVIIGSISVKGVFNSVSNLVGFPNDVINSPFDINGVAKNIKTGALYITENLCMLIINSNLSLDLWFPW